jgi:DNA-binding NarL/FixJ family response regulator
VEKHSSLKPHLIIIDENVPGLSGTEATRQIRQTDGEVKILFYTGHSAGAELAFLAGANGFLTKDAPLTSLLAAIEALRSGGIYVEQRAWGPLRSRFLAADPDMPMLTEEEMLVVPLLRAGHSSKEIADLLGLKIRRVEKIRGRLMHKTHSANTTAFVAKLGLYTPARSPQPVGI